MLLSALVLVAFPLAMAFAAASDLLTMRISNRLQLALVAGFAVAALAAGLDAATIGWHLAAGAIVLAVGFACFAFGWIGGGDAKLAAATALWLGLSPNLADYALLAALFGGALTLVLLLARASPLAPLAAGQDWAARLLAPRGGVPYGIALAAAGLAVWPATPWMSAVLPG
jgi:prepilin peptidase CpaA